MHNLQQAGRLQFSYEKPLKGGAGNFGLPDFTVETATGAWYWEHCGMLGLPEYARRWREKQEWYRSQGIKQYSVDNPNGRLIVTEDALNGGIDSASIHQLADGLFS